MAREKISIQDFPKKSRIFHYSASAGDRGGGFLGIKNPVLWVLAAILVIFFLAGGFSGGFKGFQNIGEALGSIPTGVWAILIIVFFWFRATRRGK